jgi:hypothetical protein
MDLNRGILFPFTIFSSSSPKILFSAQTLFLPVFIRLSPDCPSFLDLQASVSAKHPAANQSDHMPETTVEYIEVHTLR